MGPEQLTRSVSISTPFKWVPLHQLNNERVVCLSKEIMLNCRVIALLNNNPGICRLMETHR